MGDQQNRRFAIIPVAGLYLPAIAEAVPSSLGSKINPISSAVASFMLC